MASLIGDLRRTFEHPTRMLDLVQAVDKLVIQGSWNLNGIHDPRYLIKELKQDLTALNRDQHDLFDFNDMCVNAAKLAAMTLSAYMIGDLSDGGKDTVEYIIDLSRGPLTMTSTEQPLFSLAYDIFTVGISIMPFKIFRALVDRQYPGNKLFKDED